eukprot:TRINITY_DN12235_c0_g1_i1.p1 TRINITY_DN12235_c0_g1~~TRINITY_DN12235_c0_g1_i1.p1  ORF type:complete len:299 (+),score=44.89 TRINITY_DN12235_c0_g1_i1:1-897(+)
MDGIPTSSIIMLSCKSTRDNVFVGTSGYQYTHWRGRFYPEGLPQKEEFEFYAHQFNAVELNSTFYGTPSELVFDTWRAKAAAVSDSVKYSIKANQFFTHRKQFNVDDVFKTRWRDFWGKCKRLGPHLGCVIFQLPHTFQLTKSADKPRTRATLDRLHDLGRVLPRDGRFVFEFRHPSWFGDADVLATFRRFNWCLCLVNCSNESGWAGELPSGSNPEPQHYPLTCDWGVYFRFHGSEGQYVGSYGKSEMKKWASRLHKTIEGSARIGFAFFNNTDDGEPLASAIVDATNLQKSLLSLI